MDIDIKKYPTSIHNKRCIGPCLGKNEWWTHPITLELITNKDQSFCVTEPWFDEKTKRNRMQDECYLPINKPLIPVQQLELNMIVPTFHFSCEYFLRVYYDIYSFESAVDWVLMNKDSPILSVLRIMDCAWNTYGNSLDVVSEQLIDVYLMIIKKNWIKDIYPLIAKYISVDKDIITLSVNEDDPDENKIARINFFFKKVMTRQFVYKTLQSYIETNKSNWADITSHTKELKSYFIDNIIGKIIATLEK